MTIESSSVLKIAAGVMGTIFVAYCFYFDRKRRMDPDFKKKLKERRRNHMKSSRKDKTHFPDLRDHEAVQGFFLKQVQMGEELLGQGDVEGGVERLGYAVAVCGQPNQLLQVLQQTLPPHVFSLLIERLPTLSQRVSENPTGSGDRMVEDEVE